VKNPVVVSLSVALILAAVAACGGTGATTAPTAPPSSRAQSSNPAASGGALDVTAVQAAVTALKTGHDSWQFTTTTYESGTPNFSRNVSGTQRVQPDDAVSLTISQAGKPDKRYTRIGTDVWFDTGNGTYTKTKVSDQYVVPQFEPYYLNGLVSAAEVNGYEFNPVGADTVSGVAATHYRLADTFLFGIVANMSNMTPADWAADVWIADADGSLLRLAWGPTSVDKAQLQTGFDYVVTSIDCSCPVNPPA